MLLTDELWAAMVQAIHLQTGVPRLQVSRLVDFGVCAWGEA